MSRVILQSDALDTLPSVLSELGSRRILLITGPEKRFLERVNTLLAGFEVELAPFAQVHVPQAAVDAADEILRGFEADTLLTVGGGAATGLGKALRLSHDVKFVAVPTTYAGSEMTNIYGITRDGDKNTGRDDRVSPDVVVYDPRFTERMPQALTVTSLLNALAHPVSALANDDLPSDLREEVFEAAALTFNAALQLIERPGNVGARVDALKGASMAARILSASTMGPHHRVAHAFGGRFDLPHAELHALLLPHTIYALGNDRPDALEALSVATAETDLPAAVFDLLRRAGAPTSLRTLEVGADAIQGLLEERNDLPKELAWPAFYGRRPSMSVRREDWDLEHPVSVWGDLETADTIVVALHGRGSNADEVLTHILEWPHVLDDLAIVAPQAEGAAWYTASYRTAVDDVPEAVTGALGAVDTVLGRVLDYVPRERVVLYGFSQGACLAAEYAARAEEPLGALIAVAGARVGPVARWPEVTGDLDGMPVLLSVAEEDAWIEFDDALRTRDFFEARGAEVTFHPVPGESHLVSGPVRVEASRWLSSAVLEDERTGFGNTFEVELMPGALPRGQNSPRWAKYGLYSEQINATAFVAPRAHNIRAWLYRIRPSSQQGPFAPLRHRFVTGAFDQEPAEVNLVGFSPMSVPEDATDFVDGLVTMGGSGSPN
ncbi:MAG: iron-containing alcohol dehydrogenase, partial [Myxococcota bacterium]